MVADFKLGGFQRSVPGGGTIHVTELDFVLYKSGPYVYIESGLQQGMAFLPVQLHFVVDSGVFRIEYGVHGGGGVFAQSVGGAYTVFHSTVGNHFPGEHVGYGKELAENIVFHFPVVVVGAQAFPEPQGTQRRTGCLLHFPVHSAVNQGGDISVFVKGYGIDGGGQHIAFCPEHTGSGTGSFGSGQTDRTHGGNFRSHGSLRRTVSVCVGLGQGIGEGKRTIQDSYAVSVKGQGIVQGDGTVLILCQRFGIVGGKSVGFRNESAHFREGNFVYLGNAGAGQNVVELVFQKDLVHFVPDSLIGSACQYTEQFHVPQGDFCHTVVLLHVMHLGQGASVVFQIQFSVIQGQSVPSCFQLLHVAADRGGFDGGHTFQILHPLHVFQHTVGGSSAAVAETVGNQSAVVGMLVPDFAYRTVQVVYIGNQVHPVQVGHDFGAVDAAPYEGVCREGVQVTPGHLGGVEVLDPCTLHDLGNGTVVPEGVGQPECVGTVAEILLGEPLAVQELPYHGFAAGDVAVTFHPYAAVGFIPAFGNLLTDAFKNIGVVFPHPVQMESGRLNEGVVRVELHEGQGFGVGSGALADGFGNRPEPCGVHVGVTDEPDVPAGTVAAGMLFQGRSQNGKDLFRTFPQFLHGGGAYILNQIGESVHQAFVGFDGGEIVVRQTGNLQNGGKIEAEIPEYFIQNAETDALILFGEVGLGSFLAVAAVGTAAQTVVSGVAFKVQNDLFPGLGTSGNEHGGVHGTQEVVLGVDDSGRLSVPVTEDFHSFRIGNGAEDLSVGSGRNGDFGMKPYIAVFVPPGFTGSDGLHGTGTGGQTQMFIGGIGQYIFRLSDGPENVCRIPFQHIVILFVCPLDIGCMIHHGDESFLCQICVFFLIITERTEVVNSRCRIFFGTGKTESLFHLPKQSLSIPQLFYKLLKMDFLPQNPLFLLPFVL